jgi:hypothetical protein
VRALEVRHGLKALLPHAVFLILNQEKHGRHRCGSSEATLTQRGECDVCRLLNGGVGLAVDDGSRPQLRGVEGIVTLVSHMSRPSTIDKQQR